MDAVVRDVLTGLEADYGRSGWHGDEVVLPTLYRLHCGPQLGLRWHRLVVPGVLWSAGPPADVLRGLAADLSEYPSDSVPEGLLAADWRGLGIVGEAWAADRDDVTDEMVCDRQVRTHPSRETIRVAHVVLADGRGGVLAHRVREGDVHVIELSDDCGDVAPALEGLVVAVQRMRSRNALGEAGGGVE